MAKKTNTKPNTDTKDTKGKAKNDTAPKNDKVDKAAKTIELPAKETLAIDDLVDVAVQLYPEGEELSKKDTKAAITAFLKALPETVKAGKKFQVTGYLTGKPAYRGARKANDISTQKPMDIPESVGVSISAGTILKEAASGLNPADFKPEPKAE